MTERRLTSADVTAEYMSQEGEKIEALVLVKGQVDIVYDVVHELLTSMVVTNVEKGMLAVVGIVLQVVQTGLDTRLQQAITDSRL